MAKKTLPRAGAAAARAALRAAYEAGYEDATAWRPFGTNRSPDREVAMAYHQGFADARGSREQP